MSNTKYKFDVEGLRKPDECIREVLNRCEHETKRYVKWNLKEYEGEIYSKYENTNALSAMVTQFTSGKLVENIQDQLGAVEGKKEERFECFLTAPALKDYKYRLLFLEYGIGGYPATIVLDENIARYVNGDDSDGGFIFTCRDMAALNVLVERIMSCEYLICLVQSIINESMLKEGQKHEHA